MTKNTNYVFNHGQCPESGLHCIPKALLSPDRERTWIPFHILSMRLTRADFYSTRRMRISETDY